MPFKSWEIGTETSAGENEDEPGVSSEYVNLGIHPENKDQ